ncbi:MULTISPECIES: hypothetical protein [unclassified Lacinutrix]
MNSFSKLKKALGIFEKPINEKESVTKKYIINIDPNSQTLSKEFKDFYYNHFVEPYGLSRNEVDTSFFKKMSTNELEISKDLIRKNLHLKYSHLFKASGELKDEKALPILYKFLNIETDLSWKLTIGRAIWRINNDNLYEKLLMNLATSKEENLKYIHFEQVYDLGEKKKVQFLKLMVGNDETLSERRATEILNRIKTKSKN